MDTLDNDTLHDMIAALNTFGCGVAVYGPKFEPIYASERIRTHIPQLCASLEQGASLEQAVSNAVRHVIPDMSEEQLAATSDFLAGKIRACEEVEFHTIDGRILRAYHGRMPNGGIVGISTDVTSIRENERALRHAEREAKAASDAKSAFLATMSHEIRTPLNGVLGMAKALAKRPLPDAERDMVETIIQSSKALMVILNDVLDLSKVEAGRIDLVPVPNDIRHKLRQIERLHRESADAKGLVFRTAVHPDVPSRLVFDPVRVRQCLINLISNAIKFTDKGSVHVAVTCEPVANGQTRVIIHVHDTGIGISEEAKTKLFQNFVQADRSTTRKYGGSGLGLSITRQLLGLMGGDIQLVSEVGRGSVFTMSFVCDQADSADPSHSARTDGPGDSGNRVGSLSGVRALLVDDNSVNRQVARMLLEPFGLEFRDASSGEMALAALADERFDLVLLDIHMPEMDGPETFNRIRNSGERWSNIPVIALTADAMKADRDRYLALGMNGYASKPIEERELVASIFSALVNPAVRQAAG